MGELNVSIGDKAPDFCLKDSDGNDVCLKDFKGKNIVIYFYPKDNTPGCTQEAKDFTLLKSKFDEKNTVVIGVSPDSPKTHTNFISKHGLDLILLSDPEHIVLNLYGVWQKKKMCGKECEGVVRSTILIDTKGIIKEIWTNVKVKGHVEAVCERGNLLGG